MQTVDKPFPNSLTGAAVDRIHSLQFPAHPAHNSTGYGTRPTQSDDLWFALPVFHP